MSVVGGQLRYRNVPVLFNNWNHAFSGSTSTRRVTPRRS